MWRKIKKHVVPVEQKFPNGTRISKEYCSRYNDEEEEEDIYNMCIGVVQSYCYCRDRGKWMYNVLFPWLDLGCHNVNIKMTEEQVAECCSSGLTDKPEAYYRYYFGPYEDYDNRENMLARVEVDWKLFGQDLNRIPKIALEHDFCHCSALHYAVLARDVPIAIIEKLLKIHPEARKENPDGEDCPGILNWIINRRRNEFDQFRSDILRLVLSRDPDLAVERRNDMERASYAVDAIIRHTMGPISDQIKVVLETSPIAVGNLLARQFERGDVFDNDKLFEFTMRCARRHLRSHFEVFCMELEDMPNLLHRALFLYIGSDDVDDGDDESRRFTLFETIFRALDDSNKALFPRYIKMFAEALHEKVQSAEDCAPRIDLNSTTCCVLYTLSIVPKQYSWVCKAEELWTYYFEYFCQEVSRETKDSSPPLFTAIRLGHGWNPVLKDIIQQDKTAVDFQHTPAFIVAATVNPGDEIAAVNTLFELLRYDPGVLEAQLCRTDANTPAQQCAVLQNVLEGVSYTTNS